MAQQFLVNTGTGTPAPLGATMINSNFTELYTQVGVLNQNAISVISYGADPTGVTDSTSAFITAMAAGNYVVANGTFYCANGLTIPAGVTLAGVSMLPGNPAVGSSITFANNVTTCITLTAGSNGTTALRDITINRIGTPPTASTGVFFYQNYNCQLINVNVVNHDRLYSFQAEGPTGISAHLTNCYGSKAQSYYFYLNNWPELYVLGGRFGANGAGDYNCLAVVYLKGDSSAGGGLGPNTVTFVGSHFNQGGGNTPTYFWQHDSDIEPIGNQVEYKLLGCHVENIGTAIFSSTASGLYFGRFNVTGTVFNTPSAAFFSLNSGTQAFECIFNGNHIYTNTVTLNQTPALNYFSFIGNQCTGAVSITGTTGSTAVLTGNEFRGGLTLAGVFGQLALSGGNIPDGLYTNTATGAILIDDAYVNRLVTWTPTLAFTTSTGTNTYSLQQGWYQRKGNLVTLGFAITLTAFGTNSGNATINASALPGLSVGNPGTSGTCNYVLNMTGLSSGIIAEVGSGPTINLYQSSTSGVTNVTSANFTSTTILRGWCQYVINQV